MSQITKTGPLAWWMAGRRPAEPQQESSSASIGLMTIAREAHPAVSIPSGQPGVTRLRRHSVAVVAALQGWTIIVIPFVILAALVR
jgi:hypothetical protein